MNNPSVTSTCRLCGKRASLVDSHIVPQFVYDWMKETGGYIRAAGNPNVRLQDGPKPKLLCQHCDNELFAASEGYFSKTMFHPYLNTRANAIAYDDRLMYFLVSVLWRAWAAYPKEMIGDGLGRHFVTRVHEAETEWHAYLLNGTAPLRYGNVHLVLGDTVVGPEPVPGFNDYVTRSVDWTVAANEKDCVVYVKFARFLIFGEIAGEEPAKWVNTRIDLRGSILSFPQTMTFGALLIDRARGGRSLFMNGISARQREVIDAAGQNAPPGWGVSGMM